jgi:hypothetical protein
VPPAGYALVALIFIKRRENASFLGFSEIVFPAARTRAASPSKKNYLQINPLADHLGWWHAICDA